MFKLLHRITGITVSSEITVTVNISELKEVTELSNIYLVCVM